MLIYPNTTVVMYVRMTSGVLLVPDEAAAGAPGICSGFMSRGDGEGRGEGEGEVRGEGEGSAQPPWRAGARAAMCTTEGPHSWKRRMLLRSASSHQASGTPAAEGRGAEGQRGNL